MVYFTLYELTCRKANSETNGIMFEYKDYLSNLNKARKKRNQNTDPRYPLFSLAVAILMGLTVVGIKTIKKPTPGRVAGSTPSQEDQIATPV